MSDIPKIDINKSIRKERLTYMLSAYAIFNYIFAYFFIVILMGLSIILLVPAKLFAPHASTSFLAFAASGIFNTWIIADIILVNKLIKIKREIGYTHEKILHAISLYNADMKTIVDEENAIIQLSSIGFFSWGSVLTILITDDNIYLNLSALGLGRDIISPFHAVYNYYKCKRIAMLIIGSN